MSFIKKTKNVLIKSKKSKHEFWYYRFYKHAPVKANTVLLESTHGKSFNSHLYYIAKQLGSEKRLNIYIVSNNPEPLQASLKEKGFRGFKVIKFLSKEYCKRLATCEYLINDTTFWPFFNKKEGQKYFNIWHGTPLKHMGKDLENPVDVANVQRNFYMADRILFSNEYTKDIMVKANNLTGIYGGKIVVAPSPRNSILYDDKSKENIRAKYAPNGEKIVVYMPTWRGGIGSVESDVSKLTTDLIKISNAIDSKIKFFVKLHPFQKGESSIALPNIYEFPDEELYEFLSGTDVLVTDYSSIMYDFLNTNKEIILYAYDKNEYYQTRGVYEDIYDYPFAIAEDIDTLVESLLVTGDVSYNSFKDRFCALDNINGTKQVTDYLFDNKKDNIHEYNIHNGKETVAILSGGFWDNGITTALINTLEGIDTSKRNYLLFFGKNKLQKQHFFRVRNLPENVLYYPVPGQMNGNLFERFIIKRYLFSDVLSYQWIEKILNIVFKKRLYKSEFKRIFGDLNIDYFVHYTGFERKYAEMAKHINSKSIMFIHTDMFKEYKAKKSFNKQVIFGAYQKAYRVAIVNEKLKTSLVHQLPFLKGKITVVNNFLGEKKVQDLASQDLVMTLKDVALDFVDTEGFEVDVYNEINDDINNFIEKQNLTKENNINYTADHNESIESDLKLALENNFEYEINMIKSIEFYKYIYNISDDKLKNIVNDLGIVNTRLEENLLSETVYSVLSEKYYKKKLMEKMPHVFENQNIFKELIADVSLDLNNRDTIDELGIDKVRLLNNLMNPEHKVFINIGRYAYEKGHARLIESFEQVFSYNPNISLVIVAPHGPLKLQTISQAEQSFASKNIFILGRMSNPYALLKACDVHVLSSYYEGLGLVAFEALAIGTDLITVNLPETVKHLDENSAIIVDNSTAGIYSGMQQYLMRDMPFNKLNFDSKLQASIQEFESLFSND